VEVLTRARELVARMLPADGEPRLRLVETPPSAAAKKARKRKKKEMP